MAGKKIFFALFFILLFGAIISAREISKDELKPFLSAEIKNYLEGKPTLLNNTELRELINIYFSSLSSTIELDDSSLSSHVLVVLEDKFPQDELKVETLKNGGEICKLGSECTSGVCKKSCNFLCILVKTRCTYPESETLKATGESCLFNSECASNVCKKKVWFKKPKICK